MHAASCGHSCLQEGTPGSYDAAVDNAGHHFADLCRINRYQVPSVDSEQAAALAELSDVLGTQANTRTR